MQIYLVAYYYQKPSNHRVRTQIAGWMKDQKNVSWDEQVSITRNLRNRDLSTARVILDLTKQKVVRNSWNSDSSFADMFEYFVKNYPEQTRGLREMVQPKSSVPEFAAVSSSITSVDTSSLATK